MSSSLRGRLALGFAAIAVAIALLAALGVNLAFKSRFDDYLDQQRGAQVQQLAAAVTVMYQAGGGWDTDRLDQLAGAVAMTGADIRLLDTGGTLIWPTADSSTSEMAQMHQEMMGGTGPLAAPIRVPIAVDGQSRGTLQVALPEGNVPVADQQFRSGVNRMLLLGGVAFAVVASALGAWLARRVTRPVAELTAAARDLRAGDRTRRAAVSGPDEVAALARAFNDLAASAEEQEALRQSFAADVAHELRTPLTILRSQLEAAQDGVVELTPALVSSLHEETVRLGRLTADLETLTSADAAAFSLQRAPLDLADVARSVTAGFQHRLAERGLHLDLTLRPALTCGDPSRLAQVVTNLLSNAAKFVPAGGRVTVATDTDGGLTRLCVSDDGPGIPEAELPHVFDRYFRGSNARANGSGIGLAVVAALIHAHGGNISAANAPGGGAVFTVALPVTDMQKPVLTAVEPTAPGSPDTLARPSPVPDERSGH
ncbi:two-component system, OmpR family, sensor histidine kinase BaeS [Modestobacter sp. DSM 44400]|uniref:sensor histidine kinase n=1 Tax=Modestobacter sp. DSM 44400 TaxID=1550230 RepID=UPI0008989E94|nr:ATP-binding protein [Modestobacter sp. DSM 44400]SDY65632.1 two-component system, OmpR family, sensor histidine kinase BaeS [Modestobacter sp. DSM 44400]